MITGLLIAALSIVGGVGPAEGAHPHARARKCTVVGTRGPDRLVGTPGRDVICGRGGKDVLLGRGGADVLIGGSGADQLEGGAGPDELLGESGGDDLDGGPAADELDGGPGANVCAADSADEASRCTYDTQPPRASFGSMSGDPVDVTSDGQSVVVRVHATDDTGVEYVAVRPSDETPWLPSGWGTRTRGTARDGWYDVTISFARWSKPGTYAPSLVVEDRLGRRTVEDLSSRSFEVVNTDPDLDLPEVTLLSPAPGTVIDTRSSAQTVTVRARIADAKTGVDPESINMDLWSGDGSTGIGGGQVTMESGTIHNGVWSVRFGMPRQSLGGEWTVGVSASDVASAGTRRRVRWLGATDYAYWVAGCGCFPGQETRFFPSGSGTPEVLGRTRDDHTPPTVSSASVGPATVDTLAGPATVTVTVDAADVGSGIAGMNASLVSADGTMELTLGANPTLRSGTSHDGRWVGPIELPQGAPPGIYYLKIVLWDLEDNWSSYGSSAAPTQIAGGLLDGATTVTVVDGS